MFSIGTNFDPNLIPALAAQDVYEVYGKLAKDIVGGGRGSFVLKNINYHELESEVLRAHKHKLGFNYLLNASCLGNIEYTRSGQKEIIRLLDKLSEIKIDTVTIAIPYLALFIKKNYPHFKLDVSVLARVDNVKAFNYWQGIGADCITLSTSVNRDFKLLKQMVKQQRTCSIKLLANEACLLDCIYKMSHYNHESHNSQTNWDDSLPVCIYNLQCKLYRVQNPESLLIAPFIRPEDLHYYQDIGITRFKLIQRQDPTDRIVRTLETYHREKYLGNLVDIVQYGIIDEKKKIKNNIFRIIKYAFRPKQLNPLKLTELKSLVNDEFDLYIDNSKLDGFIKYFLKHDCHDVDCADCQYCQKWVDKAVNYNPQKIKKLKQNYTILTNKFIDKNNSVFI